MTPSLTSVQDLEGFAEYLGLDGIDADLFYETYYDLDNEEYESVLDHDYDCF